MQARPGAVFSDPVLFIDDSTTAADTTPAPEAAPAATGTTKSALVPLSGGSQHINLSGVRALAKQAGVTKALAGTTLGVDDRYRCMA